MNNKNAQNADSLDLALQRDQCVALLSRMVRSGRATFESLRAMLSTDVFAAGGMAIDESLRGAWEEVLYTAENDPFWQIPGPAVPLSASLVLCISHIATT